jgi:dihydrofolate reductase
MTQVVYFVAASLDGFIAGPNGELDWLHDFDTPSHDYGYADFLAGVDALVMGRRTFDVTRGFGPWPYGERPTWVMTRHPASDLADLQPNVRLTGESPARLLAQWQAQGHRRVWLSGGGEVAAAFLHAGCLHELVLSVMPVTLGCGVPLFQPGPALQATRWAWQSSTPHPLDVQTLCYINNSKQ